MDNTVILAVVEALGESLAAHKSFEEKQKEYAENILQQNELLRKEVQELRAKTAEQEKIIDELGKTNAALVDAADIEIGPAYADENCESSCGELPQTPYGDCCFTEKEAREDYEDCDSRSTALD